MVFQIVASRPKYEWVPNPDNPGKKKPGKRLGTTYTIMKYKMKGPTLIDVDVPGDEVVSTEEIKASLAARNMVCGDFKDLDEDQYTGKDGQVHHTGSAESVTLIGEDTIL